MMHTVPMTVQATGACHWPFRTRASPIMTNRAPRTHAAMAPSFAATGGTAT